MRNPDRHEAARYITANASNHADFCCFVSSGDRYRDARQWVEGFAAYRSALDILPLHAGYLVQAGHCLKEAGLMLAAEGYYRSGLLLGAPLGDVEEHLLFVCRKNQYKEDAVNLRQLAGEVQDNSSRVAFLPTLDELMGVAERYCTPDDIDIAELVDLMRCRATFEDAIERLRSRGRKPTALLRRRGARFKSNNTFQFTLRTPLSPNPSGATSGSPGLVSHPASSATPPGQNKVAQEDRSARERSRQPIAIAPVPIAAIRATARLFVAGRLDPTTPLFFGAAPATRDPVNVSHDTHGEPVVSVIILNHNSADLALLAAGSIMASRMRLPYEILLVDNGSRSSEKAVLQRSTLPFRLIDLADNLGFGEGNNIAADAARGQYLLLLNSDAFVSPHAVDRLIETLETVEDAAAVGPIFRYPGGLLQEAGAFVSADGSTLQRGKRETSFDASKLPAVDVVDYVSAACLLIRRHDFMAVGGFPPQYHLAYSEDVDLCLRLRLLRKIVVMARDAVCFHVEGVTASIPELAESSNFVAAANQHALLGSWAPYLSSRLRTDLPTRVLPRYPIAPPERGRQSIRTAALLAPTRPIRPDLRYLMSLTANAADAAILAFTTACSRVRLRNLETWLECPFQFEDAISTNDLASQRPAFLLLSDASHLPQTIPASARALLVVSGPPVLGDPVGHPRWQTAERIDRFERVLVPSRIAREALLSALDRRSLPRPRAIDIITPSIPNFDASPRDHREPWVLTVTGFGEPGHQSAVFAIIDALSKSGRSVRNDWKLVVCGEVHCARLAVPEMEGLRKAACEAGVSMELIVSPPPDRLESLYLRSAIFIEARGFGYSCAGTQWRCDLLGTRAMRGLAAGCRTLAWKEGAAAEVLRSIRAGETFGSTEELVFRLQNPPPPADTAVRGRLVSHYGDAGARARLQAILTSD